MMASLAKQEAAVQNYLTPGEHDPCHHGGPGSNLFAAAQAGDVAMRSALVLLLRSRTASLAMPPALQITDVTALTRTRVVPMVGGLFPPQKQAAVLAMLERSVVFLTPNNIESVLLSTRWLHTAWSLANLYLASVGADMLSQDARAIVGLSEETTCYVSVEYFRNHDPCAIYVVHEAAHIFHNCKRTTIGLPETRHREWLLDIDFGQRETFAYACEAYSQILTLVAREPSGKQHLRRMAMGRFPATTASIPRSTSTSSDKRSRRETAGNASCSAAPRAGHHGQAQPL